MFIDISWNHNHILCTDSFVTSDKIYRRYKCCPELACASWEYKMMGNADIGYLLHDYIYLSFFQPHDFVKICCCFLSICCWLYFLWVNINSSKPFREENGPSQAGDSEILGGQSWTRQELLCEKRLILSGSICISYTTWNAEGTLLCGGVWGLLGHTIFIFD